MVQIKNIYKSKKLRNLTSNVDPADHQVALSSQIEIRRSISVAFTFFTSTSPSSSLPKIIVFVVVETGSMCRGFAR